MMLSTTTAGWSRRFGDHEAIRMIAQAGFDAFDYSFTVHSEDNSIYGDGYREYIRTVIETARQNNITCNQAHAHIPTGIYGDDAYNERAFLKIVRGMEIASMLGAKAIIVHPVVWHTEGLPANEVMEINREFFQKLLPYCEQFQIQVALENVFMTDQKRGCKIGGPCGWGKEFRSYLEMLGSEWFVACLDLGHSSIVGDEPHNAIRKLGKKHLQALHVHDNDYCSDQHLLPYLGKLEWENIIDALAEIGYEGDFTYEADGFLRGFPDPLIPDALKFMCTVGRYLIRRIEEERLRKREK